MEKKKTFQKGAILDEVAQLKIYGGTSSPIDTDFTIYLGKGCKTWGDCKKFCNIIIQRPK